MKLIFGGERGACCGLPVGGDPRDESSKQHWVNVKVIAGQAGGEGYCRAEETCECCSVLKVPCTTGGTEPLVSPVFLCVPCG